MSQNKTIHTLQCSVPGVIDERDSEQAVLRPDVRGFSVLVIWTQTHLNAVVNADDKERPTAEERRCFRHGRRDDRQDTSRRFEGIQEGCECRLSDAENDDNVDHPSRQAQLERKSMFDLKVLTTTSSNELAWRAAKSSR